MHWHHRDPATKEFDSASFPSRSREAILAEIAKCELICAAGFCNAREAAARATGRVTVSGTAVEPTMNAL
jgi:hypothetical protein